jgi:hypothetical protein
MQKRELWSPGFSVTAVSMDSEEYQKFCSELGHALHSDEKKFQQVKHIPAISLNRQTRKLFSIYGISTPYLSVMVGQVLPRTVQELTSRDLMGEN